MVEPSQRRPRARVEGVVDVGDQLERGRPPRAAAHASSLRSNWSRVAARTTTGANRGRSDHGYDTTRGSRRGRGARASSEAARGGTTSRSDEPRDMSRQPAKSDVDELITRDLFEPLHARLRVTRGGSARSKTAPGGTSAERLQAPCIDDVPGRCPSAAGRGHRQAHVAEPARRVRIRRGHDRHSGFDGRPYMRTVEVETAGRPLISSATPVRAPTSIMRRGRAVRGPVADQPLSDG